MRLIQHLRDTDVDERCRLGDRPPCPRDWDIPVTRTRRPLPKAASLIDVSVPHVLSQAHQPAVSNFLRRPAVGTNRGTKPWAARGFTNVPRARGASVRHRLGLTARTGS